MVASIVFTRTISAAGGGTLEDRKRPYSEFQLPPIKECEAATACLGPAGRIVLLGGTAGVGRPSFPQRAAGRSRARRRVGAGRAIFIRPAGGSPRRSAAGSSAGAAPGRRAGPRNARTLGANRTAG